ncbi:MAG: hypothetical protein ABSD58_00935 [Verrucomicrobiia bacterium]|jgi:hypothetical protein
MTSSPSQSRQPVRKIRIIRTPPGEAPEDIRKAWVGLVLPLSRFRPRRTAWSAGVLTGPKTLFGYLTAVVSGRLQPQVVYVVVGHVAVDVLATESPEAAAWWREHAPHILRPGWRLTFPAEVCEEVVDDGQTQVQEARRGFGIRNFLGRLLGAFAGLFIITGICFPFYTDSSHRVDWGAAVGLIVIGLFLGFCAARIMKPSR